MRTESWMRPALILSAAFALLTATTLSVDAGTRHYRRHSRVVIAVHAPLTPFIFNAPMHVAYQSPSPSHERIFEGQPVEENEVASEAPAADESNAAPQEEAYFTSRARRVRPPRGNYSGW